MLTIPLPRLEREGTLEIRGEIPPDDPMWEGTALRFSSPLSVFGQAESLTGGEVLVRITAAGHLDQECRRCLDPLEVQVMEEFTLLFVTAERPELEDEEVRPLPKGSNELDLREAIREEMLLSQWPYPVCKPDCKGLCPRCGINLNEETCQCSNTESDPRWDALRALNKE